MSADPILYDVADHVATITFNRPEVLNAFDRPMVEALIAAFDRADADDEVRAVIVTGAGRAFSAGADLSGGAETFDAKSSPVWKATETGAFHADGSPDHDVIRDAGGTVALRIFRCLKPVIAAVNGPAVGFGATVLLPMDIRLAAADARIGFVFARRGVVPETASSWFLPRAVPLSTALEWCFTGRLVGAEEARAAGLVRSVHAPDDLLAAAGVIAREIADNAAPVSVALTRQMLWRLAAKPGPEPAHRVDSRLMYERGQSADTREGVGAFLERRAPAFPDRVSSDMPPGFPWWKDGGEA